MMDIDPNKINAEVYYVQNPDDPEKRVFWLKVHMPEWGLYISDFTVKKSIKYQSKGLWFQVPTYPVKGKFRKPLTFDGSSRLLKLLEKLCLEAVNDWLSGKTAPPRSRGGTESITDILNNKPP